MECFSFSKFHYCSCSSNCLQNGIQLLLLLKAHIETSVVALGGSPCFGICLSLDSSFHSKLTEELELWLAFPLCLFPFSLGLLIAVSLLWSSVVWGCSCAERTAWHKKGQGPSSSVAGRKCRECCFPEDEVASFLPAPKLDIFPDGSGLLHSLSL